MGKQKWTKEKFIEIASQYSSISDLRKDYGGLYIFAYRNKYIDLAFPAEKKKCRPVTNEDLQNIAKKYSCLKTFRKEQKSSYTLIIERNIKNYLDHMKRSARNSWTEQELEVLAKKYSYYSLFRKENIGAYEAAKNMGILKKITTHMITIRQFDLPVSFLLSESLKYKSKQEMKNADPALFEEIVTRKIVSKAFAHAKNHPDDVAARKTGPSVEHKNRKWVPELIHKEALKYNSRSEFYRGCMSAYGAAKTLKLLDQVCSHMVYKGGASMAQAVVFDYVSDFYDDALFNYSIKKDEIDIFIPSLNKGIEFDGSYWHRNKKDKDAKKDLRLKAVGIDILRVPEELWESDREGQLKSICQFIGKEYVENEYYLGRNVEPKRVRISFSKEELFDLVKQFKYKSDIMSSPEYKWLFKLLYRRGWWTEATSHMEKKPKNLWPDHRRAKYLKKDPK